MEKSNKRALSYNIDRIERFDDLCSMVLHNSPVSFVGYLKVFEDGTYFGLSNDLTWQQYFVNKVHTNGANFQQAVENTPLVGDFKFLWPQRLDDPVFKALHGFNIWNGLSIYKRGEDFIESWSFASRPEDDQVYQLYMNNPGILEAFAIQAVLRDKDLFDTSDPARLGCFKGGIELNTKDSAIPLLRGGVIDPKGNYVLVTKRELECLKLLSKGKTAREVGEALIIKPCTVEFYLANIKKKTGYRKKSEVLGNFFSG